MRNFFPLFQSHLDLAHQYWSSLNLQDSKVIDATCGNGHDTVFLASFGAQVFSIDIQKEALEKAKQTAQNEGVDGLITFINSCHSNFPEEIENQSVRLIVYNLGYLPGGDKGITTQVESTLISMQRAMDLLTPGGVISITCYPGHEEGEKEQKRILEFCENVNPREWSCCHHMWVNRKQSPSLIVLQKANA